MAFKVVGGAVAAVVVVLTLKIVAVQVMSMANGGANTISGLGTSIGKPGLTSAKGGNT